MPKSRTDQSIQPLRTPTPHATAVVPLARRKMEGFHLISSLTEPSVMFPGPILCHSLEVGAGGT